MGDQVATGRITGNAYYDDELKHWFYQISIPASLSPDGVRKREKSRGPRRGFNYRTKGDALEAMDRRVREIRAGKIDFSARMTLAEFIEAWTEHKQGEIPDTQIAKYRHTIETYISPWLGAIRLGDIADRLKSHYRYLSRAGKHQSCCHRNRTRPQRKDVVRCQNGGPLAASTISYVHKVLHSMLDFAVEQDLFPVHPMTKVKAPRFDRTIFTPWSAEEARRAIDIFGAEPLGLAWIIAIMQGLRRGELAGLRWKDIDLDRREMRVVNQRTRVHTSDGTTVVDKAPKGTSTRSIRMSETVVTLLVEHKRQRTGIVASGYIFVDELGEPYSPQAFYNRFKRVCRRQGLPVVRLHDLRHTFATLLFAEGADSKVVQAFLGHSTDQITRDVYIHYIPKMGEQAIAALDLKIGKSA